MQSSNHSILVAVFVMLFGLGGATLAQAGYTQLVQRSACLDYARAKALADIEHLEFEDAVIASNRFRGHICRFRDQRSGAPVLLEFDEADIPYGADTLQVLCMITAFLLFGLAGWGVGEGVRRLAGGRRYPPPPDPAAG